MAKKASAAATAPPVSLIETNIKARTLAGNVSELLPEVISEVKALPPQSRRRFLENLAATVDVDWEGMLNEHRSCMSESEAIQFGNTPIDFGKHIGTRYRDLDEGYLEFLERSSIRFLRWLRAWSALGQKS